MSIFTWFRDLRNAKKQAEALKVLEHDKIQQLHEAIEKNPDLDASTICAALESITINVKSGGTDKAKKKEGV